MPDVRDLSFQLSDVEEGPLRDHFIDVQEQHDEQKIASMYANGLAIDMPEYSMRAATPAETTVSIAYKAKGHIAQLTGRYKVGSDGKYRSIGNWAEACNFSLPADSDGSSFNVRHIYTDPVFIELFIIYKRP